VPTVWIARSVSLIIMSCSYRRCIVNKWIISLVSFVCVNCCSFAQVVLEENVDRFAPGPYTDEQFSKQWKFVTPKALNINWAHLYGKLAVVEDDTQGKVLRIAYPEGGVGPEQTGSQFVLNLPPADEYELSFKVLFEEGFDFRLGGKLPGLTSGGEKFTGGIHPKNGEGWSARFMWREGGTAELYLYYVDNKNEWGDQFPFDGVTLELGRWYEFRQRIRLNRPGKKDGRIQAWLNGSKMLDLKEMRLRIGEQGPIDSFYFSTFHGGQGSEWVPRSDSYARFDDIRIEAR